jgi:hypothetical protein
MITHVKGEHTASIFRVKSKSRKQEALFGLLKIETVMFLIDGEFYRNTQRFIPEDSFLLPSAFISESM